MADSIEISNFPDSGSKQAIALKLMHTIRTVEKGKYADKEAILDLYAECLTATGGFRVIK